MDNPINIYISGKRTKVFYFLSLMRPANVLTSATNILAGVAIAGFVSTASFFSFPSFSNVLNTDVFFLVLSGSALYAGGLVFNDVFDFRLDEVERPERALPSGKVSLKEAIALGSVLLCIGIMAAFRVNHISGSISSLITVLALVYNYKSKHYKILGPLNMGLCRALNLCLGISIIPLAPKSLYLYAVIPLLYIMAITLISHGEVRGGNYLSLKAALFLYLVILIGVIYMQFYSWPFVFAWSAFIFPPLLRALKTNVALMQRNAVKAGVLAIILMDASLAAGFAGFYYSIIIVMLLPVSIVVGKKFSIT